MLISLTRQGRESLGRAVGELINDPTPARGLALFSALPAGDRGRLLAADPRDVFVTAIRAWRLLQPGLKRDLQAGLMLLQSRLVCPSIERAQQQLRGRA